MYSVPGMRQHARCVAEKGTSSSQLSAAQVLTQGQHRAGRQAAHARACPGARPTRSRTDRTPSDAGPWLRSCSRQARRTINVCVVRRLGSGRGWGGWGGRERRRKAGRCMRQEAAAAEVHWRVAMSQHVGAPACQPASQSSRAMQAGVAGEIGNQQWGSLEELHPLPELRDAVGALDVALQVRPRQAD